MSQSLRLSEDVLETRIHKYSPSPAVIAALQAGDTTALLASHRERFGGWDLKLEDEDPDDDDDDSNDSDDDDDDAEDSDDDDDDEDDEDGPEGKKSKKSKDDADKGDPKRKIRALEDEKNRLYRGRERARQERDELRKEIDKLKADGTGDDELKKSNSELETTVRKQTRDLEQARLQIAFLSDNTYEWNDPSLALKAVNLSDLEIDDDGSVHGLTSALEALAEKSPFLLKTAQQTKRKPPVSDKPSGSPNRRRPNKTKAAAERARVAEKYKIKR